MWVALEGQLSSGELVSIFNQAARTAGGTKFGQDEFGQEVKAGNAAAKKPGNPTHMFSVLVTKPNQPLYIEAIGKY